MIYQFEHEEITHCGNCPVRNQYQRCPLINDLVHIDDTPQDNDCPLETISKTETVEPLGDDLSVND